MNTGSSLRRALPRLAAPAVRPRVRLPSILRRSTRHPSGAITFAGLLLIALLAIVGPALPLPDQDRQSLRDRLRPPLSRDREGTLHLAGTDQLGRDVLSRTIAGARLSLGIAAGAVVISGVFGAMIGLIAGYRRGWPDFVAMRLVEIQMAVPPLLLAIFLLYLLGSSVLNLIVLLSILNWWAYTRIVRGETLKLRSAAYIEAAVVAGCTQSRLLFRHLLPQLLPVLVVVAVLDFGSVMLAEAGISFLGFGVQPPDSSWGRMVAEGQTFVTTGAWWLFATPGLAIFVTVLLARLSSSWVQEMLGPGR